MTHKDLIYAYGHVLRLKWMLPDLALHLDLEGKFLADLDADLRDLLNAIDDKIVKLKEGK